MPSVFSEELGGNYIWTWVFAGLTSFAQSMFGGEGQVFSSVHKPGVYVLSRSWGLLVPWEGTLPGHQVKLQTVCPDVDHVGDRMSFLILSDKGKFSAKFVVLICGVCGELMSPLPRKAELADQGQEWVLLGARSFFPS